MRIALCKARHAIPCNHYVFETDIENVFDFYGLRNIAIAAIRKTTDLHIDLYVTGLTMALGEVINACVMEHRTLSLWHYNKKTDSYKEQKLII